MGGDIEEVFTGCLHLYELTRSEIDAVRIYLRSDSDYCNNTEDNEAEVGYAEKILQSAQKLKKRKV